MEQVADIFKPLSHSAIDLFSDNGVVFQIPTYQRAYSWSEDNLLRLLSDIADGVSRSNQTEALCFLGSIITVNLNHKINAASCPLAVVDGQQRLTSLLLLFSVLENEVTCMVDDLGILLTGELKNWLEDELKDLKAKTRKCLFDDKDRENAVWDLLPKITRQEDDEWSFRKNKYRYKSPFADYLFRYAKSRHDKQRFEYVDEKFSHKDIYSLVDAIHVFKTNLRSEVFLSSIGQVEELIKNDSLFFNLNSFSTPTVNEELLTLKENEIDSYHTVRDVIKLISFAKFAFYRVVITQVRTSEVYQFDVFEALNTTGLPLTAFEIFRAAIISDSCDENTEIEISEKNIKSVDQIDQFSLSISPKSRAREMTKLVSSFVLYMDGITPNEHLSWQRNTLLSMYRQAHQSNSVDRLINGFCHITDFRKSFWDKASLPKQLFEFEQREEILCYIDYFRESKSTLLIPILTRFLNEESANSNTFYENLKALVSFTILWRLSHTDTDGIDSVYRDLMKTGGKADVPLSLGITKKNLTMSTVVLKEQLKTFLDKKKIHVYDDWKNKAKGVGIWGTSKPTARLSLLISYHNSKVENAKSGTITKKGVRSSSDNNYIKLNLWRDNNFKTLEHIAPRNIKDGADWDPKIYTDGETITNSLGNLTLLPEAENNSVGNKPWKVKKVFYRCFAAESTEDIQALVESLKAEGVNVTNKSKKMMLKGERLGVLINSLNGVDTWNRETIDNRNEHLLQHVWEFCMKSLD